MLIYFLLDFRPRKQAVPLKLSGDFMTGDTMTVFTASSTYDELIADAYRGSLDKSVETLIVNAANEARAWMYESAGSAMVHEINDLDQAHKQIFRCVTSAMTCLIIGRLVETHTPRAEEAAAWVRAWPRGDS
jgi:hypothetical protein